jgi:putative FmdB family regulatory protein
VPVYDYVCSRCHRLTEVVHGIEAEGPRFCPECGAEGTMTKVFSAPSVHFKGSGWAKKDRSSSSRAAARSKETSGAGETKGDGSKGDGGDGSASTGTGSSGEAAGADGKKASPRKTDSSGSSGSTSGSGAGSGSSSGSAD